MGKDGDIGRVYNSLPFYGSNGGIIAIDDEVRNIIVDYYYKLLAEPNVAIGMVSTNPLSQVKKDILNCDIVEDRNCQVTTISGISSSDELMTKFHYKTRNMIRKSEKMGVSFEVDNTAMPFLYNTHRLNMEAIGGIAKPKIFFDNIDKIYKPGVDYKIWVAKLDSKPISAILLFYYKNIIEYYTPVVDAEFRNLQSNSFLIYQAMLDGTLNGYKYWNWGGTWKSQTNLYRFKSRFGAKDHSYKYYINVVNKDVFKSTKSLLLDKYSYFFTIPFDKIESPSI